MNDLDAVEIRILGCLLEKQRTTPDTYPLTLNALRLACNQSTNRDPVVDYDEELIQETLQRLHRRELTRVASGHGSRSSKYRHLMAETLDLDDALLSLLCVLMLRGDQTPGELKQRTERLHHFEDLQAIEDQLDRLIDRGLAERLARRPGEKQVRYRQLLGSEASNDGEVITTESGFVPPKSPIIERLTTPLSNGVGAEIAALRDAVQRLSEEVAELRSKVDHEEDPVD
ncbi:MAG: DUF480 domain-containing protein [Solirubrobacterales bacterium]